jgi:hypothetical protein
MPFYDKRCNKCEAIFIDVLEPVETAPLIHSGCGGTIERAWIGGVGSKVIGDEIDVTIRHGLCNADGSPRRFRSRTEMNKVAKERDLINRVEHLGSKGSDRSKHTTRWI